MISTWSKSGTTWTQQIVSQLLHGPDPALEVAQSSPWVDLRVPPRAEKLAAIEALPDPRVLKTHLPVDALVFSPRARYIYVGRDARDVMMSMHNHHSKGNALWYATLNDTPGRVGPPMGPPPADPAEYFRAWLDGDGHPFWPWFDAARSWWAVRRLPNVLLVHFADLKRDLPGEMARVAAFLGREVPAADLARAAEYCSFDWMKAHAGRAAPLGGAFWEGGGAAFVNRGVNGRWRDAFAAVDCAEYEARMVAECGAECARWFAEGGPVA